MLSKSLTSGYDNKSNSNKEFYDADGDITVWGILGGIAHAGSKGNITSKVRALKLNAIQLRIAGLYARRNDTLNVPYVQKTNDFTPEEAQIEEGKIVIYKKLRRD